MVDLVRCLEAGKDRFHLDLTALELDCSYTGPPIDQGRHRFRWCDVRFIDMNGAVIAEFDRLLSYAFIQTRSYAQCTTTGFNEFGGSFYCYLEDITSASALLDFIGSMPDGFSCHEATFSFCDGLDSTTLQTLSAPMTGTDIWWCPYLRSLTIDGCTNFTSADLRMLVEARWHSAATGAGEGEPGFVVNALETIHVQRCCELQVRDADKEWLDGHVGAVAWDDWAGGCLQVAPLDNDYN